MKPILFNTEMVRAILDGRKTVTRRVMKPQPETFLECDHSAGFFEPSKGEDNWYCRQCGFGVIPMDGHSFIHAHYRPGDIIWVRETWYYEEHMHELTEGSPDLPSGRYSFRYVYRAESPDYPVDIGIGNHGWRPSIHMPREAARLFLRVTDVRVERLQDISDDVTREGALSWLDFGLLWDATIKPADRDKYGWDANPWVWVIEFERVSKEEAEHG